MQVSLVPVESANFTQDIRHASYVEFSSCYTKYADTTGRQQKVISVDQPPHRLPWAGPSTHLLQLSVSDNILAFQSLVPQVLLHKDKASR